MSEMNQKRMLATLATLLQVYVQSHRRIPEVERDLKDGAVIAIRSLIEHGPEVDEKFIEKARSILNPYPGHNDMNAPSRESIRRVLREAGVKVEEGK